MTPTVIWVLIDMFTGQSDLSNSLEELKVLLFSDSRPCQVDSKN